MGTGLITHLEMRIWPHRDPLRTPKQLRLLETRVCGKRTDTHAKEHTGQAPCVDKHTRVHRHGPGSALPTLTLWPQDCRRVGVPPLGCGFLRKPFCWIQSKILLQVLLLHSGILLWAWMDSYGHRGSHHWPQDTCASKAALARPPPEPVVNLPSSIHCPSQTGAVQDRGHKPWTSGHLPFYRMGN